MKITVCIGSSCHLKGSRQVVEKLKALTTKHNLDEKIDIVGTFCMGNCLEGVCVTVNDKIYSVSPDSAEDFFNDFVLCEVE